MALFAEDLEPTITTADRFENIKGTYILKFSYIEILLSL